MRLLPILPIRMEALSYSTNQHGGSVLFNQSERRFLPVPPVRKQRSNLIYQYERRQTCECSSLMDYSESGSPIRMKAAFCTTNQIEAVTCSTNQNTGFISYSIINTNHSEGKNLIIQSEGRLAVIPLFTNHSEGYNLIIQSEYSNPLSVSPTRRPVTHTLLLMSPFICLYCDLLAIGLQIHKNPL